MHRRLPPFEPRFGSHWHVPLPVLLGLFVEAVGKKLAASSNYHHLRE
jgi:hypothetical protein